MGTAWIRPRGRWWWIALVVFGAAIHALIWAISEPADLFSDFYKAYFPAAERVWQNGPGPTWETVEASTVGFVNLPILVWMFVPLALLGEPAAGWAFLALGAAAMAGVYVLCLRAGRSDGTSASILALVFLANGPLINSLREGNTTHFVLLLLLLSLLLWRAGFDYAAGLALGLAALLKLPLMLFALYFLFRRRWTIVAGGATAICGALLLSVAVFGLDVTIDWYRNCVEPFIGSVVPAFNVQSVDGFLGRLETGHARLIDWTPVGMPLWHKIARSVILSAMFILAFVAVYRSSDRSAAADRPSERDALEFSIVLVLAIVTSPLSWTHYYALFLLPFALHLGGSLGLPKDPATRRLMGGAMVLISLPVVILPLAADPIGAIASRTVVSACLFGGLLLFAALVRGALLATAPAGAPRRQATSP